MRAPLASMIQQILGYEYVITSIVFCGMQLLIHAQTSTHEVGAWKSNHLPLPYKDVVTYSKPNFGVGLANL